MPKANRNKLTLKQSKSVYIWMIGNLAILKKNEEYMVHDHILWNARDENYFEYLKGRKLMILQVNIWLL